MRECDQIYEALKFLENYSFKSQIIADGKKCYVSFFNDSGCFTYHTYPQFGDFNILISNTIEEFLEKKYKEDYSINWIVQNILPIYKKENPNHKPEILDLVVFYIKQKINAKENFFGLTINRHLPDF